jgi:hypothetical protein
MSLTPQEKAERKAEKRAEKLREDYEHVYEEHSEDQLKEEIHRLLMSKRSVELDKEETMAGFNDVINQKKDAIEYCTERIDYLRQQALNAERQDESA